MCKHESCTVYNQNNRSYGHIYFCHTKRAIMTLLSRNSSLYSHPQMYYLNFGRLPSAKARTPSRKSSVAPKEF